MYSKDIGNTFGWSSADHTAPTYDDYKQNGKYCKSGIAFALDEHTAKCTSIDFVKFWDKETNDE